MPAHVIPLLLLLLRCHLSSYCPTATTVAVAATAARDDSETLAKQVARRVFTVSQAAGAHSPCYRLLLPCFDSASLTP